MIKRLLTYLYIKYIYIPETNRKLKETGYVDVEFTIDAVDPNWRRIKQAMYEKQFNTEH